MTRPFRIGPCPSPHVLVPYDRREAISTAEAAKLTGFSPSHLRRLAATYDLGRRIGGGRLQFSRVALRAFVENNAAALAAYHRGAKSDPAVEPYFKACGMI